MSSTMRTDAGVLKRRQAERRWSGREQDGVASEHNGALPNFIFNFSLVFVLKSMNTFYFHLQ